jgi:hypothetical protein
LGTESRGASNLTLSGIEHEGLVEATETVDLSLSSLQPILELLFYGLEVPNVTGSPIKQRHLARLLIRGWKGLLQAGVSIAELITPPLLRLDALLPDRLTTSIVVNLRCGGGKWVKLLVVVFLAVQGVNRNVIAGLAASPTSTKGGAVSRNSNRIEAM